jgi:hypothetical protein
MKPDMIDTPNGTVYAKNPSYSTEMMYKNMERQEHC